MRHFRSTCPWVWRAMSYKLKSRDPMAFLHLPLGDCISWPSGLYLSSHFSPPNSGSLIRRPPPHPLAFITVTMESDFWQEGKEQLEAFVSAGQSGWHHPSFPHGSGSWLIPFSPCCLLVRKSSQYHTEGQNNVRCSSHVQRGPGSGHCARQRKCVRQPRIYRGPENHWGHWRSSLPILYQTQLHNHYLPWILALQGRLQGWGQWLLYFLSTAYTEPTQPGARPT